VDIEPNLRNGRLVQVLPQYFTTDAGIHACTRSHRLTRVRAAVDFVALTFTQQAAVSKP
jgi:hypothetical protein